MASPFRVPVLIFGALGSAGGQAECGAPVHLAGEWPEDPLHPPTLKGARDELFPVKWERSGAAERKD